MSGLVSTAKLGEIAELNPPLAAALGADDEVSFMPMAAVDADSVTAVNRETRRYSAVSKGYTPFLDGDVLVAKITPCFENGKIAQVRLSQRYGFGSTEFHVVRPRSGRADARYLVHFLRQDRIRMQGESRMTGSAGQRRVPENFLAGLTITLPPLPEQRRIAEILDKVDALRAKRRNVLAQLDTLTQSIFHDMFGDPATNPKGWPESMLLGDAADIVSGVTIGRKLDGEITRSVPYLAVVNVQDRRLDLSVTKTTDATEEEIQRYRLARNDLLLTEGGDPDKLGRGTLWNDELLECIHQNHVFRVRLHCEELTPLFLNWLVGSQRGKRYFLRSAKQTTGIASINMTQLRAFPLLLPPLTLQHEFADQVSAANTLATRHLDSLNKLDSLFAALQHRAFRGEL